MMLTSDNVDKVLPALFEVKKNLGKVTKSADNPFFKSKYADLNTHLEVVESVLESKGLILLQPVVATGEGNMVESRIYHAESGQYVSSSMKLVGELDMQKAGSGVTYARRYTLGALLSLQSEDDDGEATMSRNTTKTVSTKSKSKKTTGFRKSKTVKKQEQQTGDDI